jgi:hypothetical protein
VIDRPTRDSSGEACLRRSVFVSDSTVIPDTIVRLIFITLVASLHWREMAGTRSLMQKRYLRSMLGAVPISLCQSLSDFVTSDNAGWHCDRTQDDWFGHDADAGGLQRVILSECAPRTDSASYFLAGPQKGGR